jgi:hypothetical protein
MGYATPMFGPVINPHGDSLPDSPVDWVDVPLGPGQEHRPVGRVQFTKDGSPYNRTDTQREPGYESLVVESRWPERPA